MLRGFILAIFVFVLSSCASLSDKKFSKVGVKSGQSLVYVYRINKFAGSAGSPYVCIDGKVVGEVVNGGYFPTQIVPGRHEVSLKSMGETLTKINFLTKKGKTYFLRFDASMSNGAKEQVMNSHMHAGPAGGGAIGGAASAIAANYFMASEDEKMKVKDAMDKRAIEKVMNPGFTFVSQKVGLHEIKESKLFEVPKYKSNKCAPIKRRQKAEKNAI